MGTKRENKKRDSKHLRVNSTPIIRANFYSLLCIFTTNITYLMILIHTTILWYLNLIFILYNLIAQFLKSFSFFLEWPHAFSWETFRALALFCHKMCSHFLIHSLQHMSLIYLEQYFLNIFWSKLFVSCPNYNR